MRLEGLEIGRDYLETNVASGKVCHLSKERGQWATTALIHALCMEDIKFIYDLIRDSRFESKSKFELLISVC